MRIKELIPIYLKHLHALGRSPYTIKGERYGLKKLIRFLEGEKIHNIEDMTSDILSEYQEDLAFSLTAKGTLLTAVTQERLLVVARNFTRFLKDKDYLLHDPGQSIKYPKKPNRLPKTILSKEEVKKLLNAPDIRTNKGYRDRTIMELLYDTGIRRSELGHIKLTDLDLDGGYIRIHGKGRKDRVVPLSQRVCDMVRNYILAVRPSFINGDDPGYLILNRWGDSLKGEGVNGIVKKYAQSSRIKKHITTHTLRHTCATHMLRNGAPLRHIQEMLGHESLESTQLYTRVTINDLKEIHTKYHPSETMK
jgi:integrase/recombinase XerD